MVDVERGAEPTGDEYDVVVVGAGMAGLTTGGLLARAGRRVLVVEEHERVGGHCRSLLSDNWRFDPAVHFIMGAGSDGGHAGLVSEVMDLLGVTGLCELVAVDPFFEARFPDLSVRVGAGRQGFIEALCESFPEERAGVQALVELGDAIYEEFARFPIRPGPMAMVQAPARFPNLFRHRNDTVAAVADRHLVDPRLKGLYASLFPYIGLPPSQASFIDWAAMMASFLGEGVFYSRGGFQELADAFAEGLTIQGGELTSGRGVRRIRLEDGRAAGVELDDGRFIRAADVVATGDARRVFTELIGHRHLSARYRRKLHKGRPSIGVLEMYLGTDLDIESLGAAHETVVWPTWDLDAAFAAALGGEASAVMVTIPTLNDPTRAPEGCHQVVIAGIAPRPEVMADPARVAAGYLAAAESVLPGLGDHLVHITGRDGVPTTAMPPPLHCIPDIYGWAATPQQSGTGRLAQVTPIPGLTLAGQWTQPGHGVWTVIASGVQAARLVLDECTNCGLLPLRL